VGADYFIVCSGVDSATAEDGTPIRTWFEGHAKIMCAPVILVASIPPNAVEVPTRTLAELAIAKGDAVTVPDLFLDLSLLLPKTFPRFKFSDLGPGGAFTVTTESSLTEEEKGHIQQAFRGLAAASLDLHFDVVPGVANQTEFQRIIPGDLDLIPGRALPSRFTSDLRWLVEEDEERWVTNRVSLFTGKSTSAAEYLPPEFRPKRSRCLIDSTAFPPPNVRMFLPLFEETVLTMPLADTCAKVLNSLAATEAELVSLAEAGRVRFLLPQPIDRYPAPLLNALALRAPSSLLFSRTLAAATVADSRRRVPLLYPPLDITERHEVLRDLKGSLEMLDVTSRPLAAAIFEALRCIWNRYEGWIARRGATGTSQLGAGRIIAAAVEAVLGRDLLIELSHAAAYVEWAAALGATVFPVVSDSYSEQGHAELCASVYSGVEGREVKVNFGQVDVVLRGILGLENDAPIADFQSAFQGGDVDRLRGIVSGIAEVNLAPEFLSHAVSEFNGRVAQFERRVEKQVTHDFVALAGALAPLVVERPSASFVGIGVWILNQLLTKLPGGRLTDLVRGANAWARSDVVLVSRLRRRM
jgi:hypothetical protein